MNLPSRREPPHPGPLLHKCVEEREMKLRRVCSWAQLTSFFAGWVLSLPSPRKAGRGWPRAGRGDRVKVTVKHDTSQDEDEPMKKQHDFQEAGMDTFRGSRSSRPQPSASRRRHQRVDQLEMVWQDLTGFEPHASRRDAGWSDRDGRAPQTYSDRSREHAAIRHRRIDTIPAGLRSRFGQNVQTGAARTECAPYLALHDGGAELPLRPDFPLSEGMNGAVAPSYRSPMAGTARRAARGCLVPERSPHRRIDSTLAGLIHYLGHPPQGSSFLATRGLNDTIPSGLRSGGVYAL